MERLLVYGYHRLHLNSSGILVQKQVAITLYWLASSAEYRAVGNLFGVGKSTVCSIVHKVCEAIYEDLLNVHVYVRLEFGNRVLVSPL
jgi:hypothetical protein